MAVHNHNLNTLVYTAIRLRHCNTIYNQHFMKDCYFIFDILTILSISKIDVILARSKGLPKDDVLTSKHVRAYNM
jgi:hypothetical protein